jgi:hypothetical protein
MSGRRALGMGASPETFLGGADRLLFEPSLYHPISPGNNAPANSAAMKRGLRWRFATGRSSAIARLVTFS